MTSKGANSSSTTDYEQLGYDANSNVTSRTLRDGQSMTFTYDKLDRLGDRARLRPLPRVTPRQLTLARTRRPCQLAAVPPSLAAV
ncbi:MAG TPA: RHS repeat domain-containing protein [Sphingomicrobium sp.]